MTKASQLTAERARELLNYDPLTGLLTWKISRGGHVQAGAMAGSRDATGYNLLRLDKVLNLGHRIAWLITYGSFPAVGLVIDHINRNTQDNRLCNLRVVTKCGNARNITKANSTNSLGTLGVSKRGNKFLAQIRVNSKGRYLGLFNTLEEASAAYQAAKLIYHPGAVIA